MKKTEKTKIKQKYPFLHNFCEFLFEWINSK